MKNKTIIALIGGTVVLAGGVFLGYKFIYKRNSITKAIDTEDKRKLIQILDELTLEYAPVLSTYASIIKGIEAESTNSMYKDQAKMMITGRMKETINQVLGINPL